MNISYNWLKDLVDIELPPQELARKLTNAGLAVEGVHAHGEDFVFDIDLTSNRPDCLSHLGVAREVSAITQSKVQSPKSKVQSDISSPEEQRAKSKEQLVTIAAPDLCQRFTARVIRNIKIAPSPAWLIARLEAVGERSINNVADITNYVMHELGQPMHSFDLSKLAEGRIVVRRARAGETIQTLDEIECKLDETMLAICDAEKPVAVAGIMGGAASGISETTTDVLLEVAYFNRDNIRATSRKLNLATEASYRFERGVDIENLLCASHRATELICELAGGTAGELADVYPTPTELKQIEAKDLASAVARLTCLQVERYEIARILDALGIKTATETLYLSPTWRHDLAIEEDLVEDVARIFGYENIAEELPPFVGAGEYQPDETRKRALRRALADGGYDEAINYSFISEGHDDQFALIDGFGIEGEGSEQFVTIRDAVIEGATRMRPTLLPGLLAAVRHNFNHARRDVRLFEIGRAFAASSTGELPYERELFALVATGGAREAGRAVATREIDFYDLKGAFESAIDALQLENVKYEAANVKHLRAGQSAAILLNGNRIGTLGRLSDELSAVYKFKQPVYLCEADLTALLSAEQTPARYRSLPRYPSVVRDISLLAARGVSFEQLRACVTGLDLPLCESVALVDIYEGDKMPEGKRSVTLRVEYRDPQRTLREEEVETQHALIVAALAGKLGAEQRA